MKDISINEWLLMMAGTPHDRQIKNAKCDKREQEENNIHVDLIYT